MGWGSWCSHRPGGGAIDTISLAPGGLQFLWLTVRDRVFAGIVLRVVPKESEERSQMGRIKFMAATAAFVSLLAACGGTTSSGSSTKTGDPIIFGSAVSLTGQQAKEGALTKQGYDLWLDWINQHGGIEVKGVKHPVQILYQDDQSKADQSAILVQKLITEQKAQYILGPYGSAATATDAVVAEKNGIPMVEANGAAQAIFSKGYKFTFAVLSPANKYLTGVVDMAATLNPKPATLAMVSADDS